MHAFLYHATRICRYSVLHRVIITDPENNNKMADAYQLLHRVYEETLTTCVNKSNARYLTDSIVFY